MKGTRGRLDTICIPLPSTAQGNVDSRYGCGGREEMEGEEEEEEEPDI